MMIDLAAFLAVCEEQAHKLGRPIPLIPINQDTAEYIHQAASLAMSDVETDNRDVSFHVASAPTGASKTLSAVAFIAAGYRTSPTFSAAFVVETKEEAESVTKLLAALIGRDNVTVWTTDHDVKRNVGAIKAKDRSVPAITTTRDALASARVAVCTSALWKDEAAKRKDRGARRFNGKRRSVVFVDEHPGLVRIIERRTDHIARLRAHVPADHPLRQYCLDPLIDGAHKLASVDGGKFHVAELVPGLERSMSLCGMALRSIDRELLREFANGSARLLEEFEGTLEFLLSVSRGHGFFDRFSQTFTAFVLDFEPGPGHVLLDATADISGMIALFPGMKMVKPPQVDYANLEVVYVEPPSKFLFLSDVAEKRQTAEPYAEWVERIVLDHTVSGDDVLVVVRKALLDHVYIKRTDDWSGRKVDAIHWGTGIGSNKWRDKTHVFLFDEFHLPKSAYIAEAHGLTGRAVTHQELGSAGASSLTGSYLSAQEGHLLRWLKQLACRGNVRNIGRDGKCGHMKLVAAMDTTRLFKHFQRLFPGAERPKLIFNAEEPTRPARKLCRLLATSPELRLSSKDVERLTGVKGRNLKQALANDTVSPIARMMGWKLKKAREIGEGGKSFYLDRDSVA